MSPCATDDLVRASGRYSQEWSSEWRTWQPAERGGPYNASAPPQGHHARYGPLRSFPYRYLMSSLRILQMRVSHKRMGMDMTPQWA